MSKWVAAEKSAREAYLITWSERHELLYTGLFTKTLYMCMSRPLGL